ncbi:trypsin-like serine peptidase [Nakamurella sp. GG22]
MSALLKRTRTVVAAVAVLASTLTATAVSTASAAVADTGQATSATSAAAAVPTTGNVSSSTSASKVTTQSFSTAAAAESYWTASRMASAVAPKVTATAAKFTAGSAAPTQKLAAAVRMTDVHSTAGTLAAPKAEPLRAKVTRPYTNRPDRMNGKVFFSEGGVDYVCSGTIVNSTNKDMIDTAGHCVSDGAGHFVSKWVFVPGYASNPSGGKAGIYPYGIWTARQLTTTVQWHYYGNIKQDLAYGVVSKLSNRHIAAYLGGQGTYFNVSRTQKFSAFGYPQAFPFNGQDQRVSVSNRVGDDLLLGGLPGPLPMRIVSNQTGGTSGGGWIVGMSASTGLGHVNGHNSYRYLSGPTASADRLYSPYYGNEALSLYNFTRVL